MIEIIILVFCYIGLNICLLILVRLSLVAGAKTKAFADLYLNSVLAGGKLLEKVLSKEITEEMYDQLVKEWDTQYKERLQELTNVSFNEMMFKFWKPVKSFFPVDLFEFRIGD